MFEVHEILWGVMAAVLLIYLVGFTIHNIWKEKKMATCKDCFHSYICFNSEGEAKYYGKDLVCNNVEQLCRKYKQKTALLSTCRDCLHNDACVDMLQALGFKVDGDGYFADKRCRTFKEKNRYSEVVRCKDCTQWCRNTGIVDSPNGHCYYHEIDMNGFDFCSYGERSATE